MEKLPIKKTKNSNSMFLESRGISLTKVSDSQIPQIKKKRNIILEDPIIESKNVNKETQLQKPSLNENLSLHSVQRHLSILKLEQYLLVITLITTAVLGRILLQPFPSIEPITVLAILAGSLFGIRKGALVGASSWYLSNFFMFGGQGPWTLVHIANGIIAGALGGLLLKKPTVIKSIITITLATIIFELSINLMSGLLFYGLIVSFITAIPFAITHLISNIAFGSSLPKLKTTILKKGKLDEINMCKKFIRKLKQKRVETNEL